MRFWSSTLSLLALVIALQACTSNSLNFTTIESGSSLQLDTLDATLVQLHPNQGLVFHDSLPFTGTAIEHYPNDQLATSITYTDGKKNGYYRKWFVDGTLSFEASYVAGKKHGETRSWWSNGNLRSAGQFDNGVANGFQQQWYPSGAKFKEIQLVNGREEGMQRSWRENGKLYNNYEARDGRIFGLKRANLCYALEDEQVILAK
jgi:hypothetical protein